MLKRLCFYINLPHLVELIYQKNSTIVYHLIKRDCTKPIQNLCMLSHFGCGMDREAWTSQAKILKWVAICFSEDLCEPGIKPRSPVLQGHSLPVEPLGKPPQNLYPVFKQLLILICDYNLFFHFIRQPPQILVKSKCSCEKVLISHKTHYSA